MAQVRAWGPALLALTLTLGVVRSAHPADPAAHLEAAAGKTCVVYRLDSITSDADLAQWIADTIPCVIEPGTWNLPAAPAGSAKPPIVDAGPAARRLQPSLRYYAPKKLLAVYHTATVHARVGVFLKAVKASLPDAGDRQAATAGRVEREPTVLRAAYGPPAAIQPASPVAESKSTYPVPPTPRAPKHLFHFIIRYEGEGIIDENVARVVKAQFHKDAAEARAQRKKEEDKEKEASTETSPASAAATAGPAPKTEESESAANAAGVSSGEPPAPVAARKKHGTVNPDRVP